MSTSDQDTDMQLQALRRAGVRKVYQEKTSSVGQRPELQRLLAQLGPGDILVVYKLDRLARSLKDLLGILERLEGARAGFKSLTEPIDTATPAGRLMLQMLGAVAEFERSLIRERVIAGQVAFVRRGGVFGRPKKLTPEQEEEVVFRLCAGERQTAVARMFNVSLIVVRRIWNEACGRKKTGSLPVLRKYLV